MNVKGWILALHLIVGTAYTGLGVLVQSVGSCPADPKTGQAVDCPLTRKDKIMAAWMALGWLMAAMVPSPLRRDPEAKERVGDPKIS